VFKKKLGFGSYGEVFLLEKMVNGENSTPQNNQKESQGFHEKEVSIN
jgi:hypothetical protein